jgi:hypothetical protein
MFDLSAGVFSSVSTGFRNDDGVVPILRLLGLDLSGQLLQLILAFGLIALLFAWDFADDRLGINNILDSMPKFVRYLYYNVLVFSLFLLGAWGSQQFIYFQF